MQYVGANEIERRRANASSRPATGVPDDDHKVRLGEENRANPLTAVQGAC